MFPFHVAVTIVNENKRNIRLYDQNWKIDKEWNTDHKNVITCLLYRKDGTLVSFAQDETIRVWNLSNYTYTEYDGPLVYHVVELQDGRLASICDKNTFDVWKIEDDFYDTYEGHTEFVSCLLCLQDGRLVSGSGDNTIRIWDVKHGSWWILKGHTGTISSLIQLPNGQLVSGALDKTIRIWNLESLTSERLPTFVNQIHQLVQIQHDQFLVAFAYSNWVFIWDVDYGGGEGFLGLTATRNFLTLPNGQLCGFDPCENPIYLCDFSNNNINVVGQGRNCKVVYTKNDIINAQIILDKFLGRYLDKDVQSIVFTYLK